jgi:RimJ/RimL family protein N-acetyltransferase
MLRVRTINDAADFVGASGDPHDYTDQIARLFEDGVSRPAWCFVIEDSRDRVGRIGFRVDPTMSDPAWLGTLPGYELSAFELDLPWTGDFETQGRSLFAAAAASLRGVPEVLEIRTNNEVHTHHAERRRLLQGLGFELFVEKQGFTWADDGSAITVPGRLTFRTIKEVGVDAFRSLMGQCGDGSLDRNDRYYWDRSGEDNWARQMTEYFADADSSMWLIGYSDDEPVGYVAVASDEDWGSTIIHIGVVPDHRGNGYIDDLIAAGTAAAQDTGITSMLSDVDVVNLPMMAAMRRAGHSENARPWHVWAYRTNLASLVV